MSQTIHPPHESPITWLRFDQQQEVMSWMSRNIVHHLALSPTNSQPTSSLVGELASGLGYEAYEQYQLYFGLQWAREKGYITETSDEVVELLPQPQISEITV